GPYELDGDGMITRGVIIRHLILPGNLENTRRVIEWVSDEFLPGDVLFSLMSQFTPCGELGRFPELQRRLTKDEYDMAQGFLEDYCICDGFFQELSSAKEEYIPPFELEGV
ncbi:MAG: radical SAM protein, partial [Oscillospiraceae bacterium]|nr:radical SAM protein [Oscillospiraceae bacterium]